MAKKQVRTSSVETQAETANDVFDYHLSSQAGDVLADRSADARLRLQALLAQWLRMENVVILLGAGASVSRGGPLLGGLEEDVLQAIATLYDDDGLLKQTAKIVEDRRNAAAAGHGAYDFERWLTFLTNAHCIATSAGSPIKALSFQEEKQYSPQALAHLIKTISQLIFLRCALRLPSPLEAVSGHHAFLAKLVARDPNLGRAHVFTTNYDTLVEQALEDMGVHYSDGFVGRVRPRFDTASYGLDIYYPGEVAEGRVRRFDKFLHLYKPHGSINWRRSATGSIIQVRDSRQATWDDFKSLDGKDRIEYLRRLFPDGDQAIGIIPTECKFVETLGMPYAHLFRAFHSHLQTPQTFLLVIGYSFGDPHINAIIDDAMTNPSLVMLIVDPVAGDAIRQRVDIYQRTGERVFLLCADNDESSPPTRATFEDFALNLLPHVKWIDDFVRLRRVERDILAVPSSTEHPDGIP